MSDLEKSWGEALAAGETQHFDGLHDVVAAANAAWKVLAGYNHNRKLIIEGTPRHGYSVRMPFRCAEKRENTGTETKPLRTNVVVKQPTPAFHGKHD